MAVNEPKGRDGLVAATRQIVVGYYHLDNGPFFEYLDDDCVWVMPNHGICRGIDEVRAQFADGWVMPSFDAHDMHFELLDKVVGDTAVVMGQYHLLSDVASKDLMAMSQHLSAVWRLREIGWRIMYLHVSAEWIETAPGEVYPVEASRQTWRYAQAIIARGLQTGGKPVTLKEHGGTLVPLDSLAILYARADGKRCVLHTDSGPIVLGCSISDLEGKLPEEFVRVHRSYLVNRMRIVSFSGSEIEMADGAVIPIPARRRSLVRQMLT